MTHPARATQSAERPAIGVRRVAGHLGAEVDDVDLSQPLGHETVAAIRAALLEHKVLFFRGQSLTHAQHVAFGRCLGPLTRRSRPQGGADLDDFPEVLTISPEIDRERYGRDIEAHYRSRWDAAITGWHSDMTHTVNPPAISILRAERVPDWGGDTHWTNLAAAYDALSPSLWRLIDHLQAEHTFLAGYRIVPHDPIDRSILDMLAADPLIAAHPVVRVHPETAAAGLFVNPSRTNRIIGFTPSQSRALLGLLFEHLTRSEFTVRWRWRPGDVACWDNRATAHLAATDVPPGAERVMHRVTVVGDVPRGPDGFRSYALAGAPFDSTPRDGSS